MNKKVQAVDENGQWEAAKITAKGQGGRATVRFVGWSQDYDRDVSANEIRPAVPFKLLSESTLSSKQRHALKFIYKDDDITYLDDDRVVTASVVIIDRYLEEVTVAENGGQKTIPASSIVYEALNDDQSLAEEDHPVRPVIKKRKKELQSDTTRKEIVCLSQDSQTEQSNILEGDDTSFLLGGIIAGKLYKVKDSSLSVVVKSLHIFSKKARCVLCHNTNLDLDFEIVLPPTRLGEELPLHKDFKKSADSYYECALARTEVNLTDKIYAQHFARIQILSTFMKEVQQGLFGKSISKKFSVGHVHPGSELFGKSSRTSYGYGQSRMNIGELDKLFGEKWDIITNSYGQTRYVTAVIFRRKPDYQVDVSVFFATCRAQLTAAYRQVLAKDVTSAGEYSEQ